MAGLLPNIHQDKDSTSSDNSMPYHTYDIELSEDAKGFIGELNPHFFRALLYIVLLFVILGFGWAWWGRVDLVSTSPFQIVPLGRLKVVQASRAGEIEDILVKVGTHVDRGQVLFKLHSQETFIEFRELEQAKADFRKAEFDLTIALPQRQVLARETVVSIQERIALMQQLMRTYHNAVQSSDNLVQGNSAANSQNSHVNAEIQFRSVELKHLKQKYEQSLKLYQKNLISKSALEDAKVQYLKELSELPSRMAEVNQYELTVRDLKRQILEQNLELEREASRVEYNYQVAQVRLEKAQKIVDREIESELDLVVAPDSGIVTQVLINTRGQVVSKGQPLIKLASASAPKVAEVMILNQDIGHVKAGQLVKLKYDAFPFQDYGIKKGLLFQIEPDVIMDSSFGPVFRGIVKLDDLVIPVLNEERPIMYGMKGMAEIITERQSIFMLLISPIRQLQESAKFNSEKG